MIGPVFLLRNEDTWRSQVAACLIILSLTLGMASGGSLALFGIGGSITLYILASLASGKYVPLDHRALIFSGALLLLVLLADLMAFAPDRSWAMSWRLTTIILPLTLLFPAYLKPVMWPSWFLRAGWVVLVIELLLIAEFLTGGGVILPLLHFKQDRLVAYNRGLCYASVLIWPYCAMLWQSNRRAMAFMLVIGLALASWLSPARSAPLALAAGGAFTLLAWRMPSLIKPCGFALLSLVAMLPLTVFWIFPDNVYFLSHIPPSWHHRFEIWDYLLRWSHTLPWLGGGVDASGVAPVIAPSATAYIYATGPAAHPHHAALQLWVELGPLGWFWGVALSAFLLLAMPGWSLAPRAGGAGAWASMVILSCGAFNLWTDSFLSLGAIAIFWLRQLCQTGNPVQGQEN